MSLLGDVIVPSGAIDPTKAPTKKIKYVDVSSVSNETFKIEQTTEMLGRDAPSRARRQIKSGDVIFATIRPTLRRIAVVPPHLNGEVCSTGYFVFRPKPTLDAKFIFYYLFTEQFMGAMDALQTGASYPAVNDKQVREQKIAFPALAEQKRIVAILDEAFEGIDTAIASAEKNLANARELFDSCLNSVFAEKGKGWVKRRLEDVVEETCSLSYGIVQPGEDVDGGLPIVRPTDLQTKIISLDGLKRIDPALAEGYKRTKLHGGELLLCVRGSTGSISIAADELVSANVTRGIVPIRFDETVLIQEFGYYAFLSKGVQDQIKAATYGAALMQINIRDLKKISLDLPPLNVQGGLLKRLANVSSKVERLSFIYKQKAATLAELKQTILENAFAGELNVRSARAVQEAAE